MSDFNKLSPDLASQLYNMVDTEFEAGSTREDVISKLALCDLESEKAELLVDTVIKSRKNIAARKTMIRYVSFSLAGFLILFAVLVLSFNAVELTQIAKYSAWVALPLLPIVGFVSDRDGKLFSYARHGVLYSLWLSSAILAGLLFMQEPWALSLIHSSAGAKGMIFIAGYNFVIHVLNFIGPVGSAILFVVLSFVALVVASIEAIKINDGIYKADD